MQSQDNLTTTEAARFLRKTPRTLIRWRSERIGPKFVKVEGAVLYRRDDLIEYLDANTVTPVAAAA